jgi:1,4-alpha-glucan branching enzyme
MTTNNFLTEYDQFLFSQGTFFRSYEKLGAHIASKDGVQGVYFSVWAPNAQAVSLIGEFNGWEKNKDFLSPVGSTGIWELFLPGVGHGTLYKFFINSNFNGYSVEKADPYSHYFEVPPRSASIVYDLVGYEWNDAEWMNLRSSKNSHSAPISIYELHLGSWRRRPEDNNRYLTYRELAEELPAYLKEMNFTHVEFLPVNEHPFDGSWGYQSLGYFAPTSRFGTPQEFMFLIDKLHQAEIGVILDWVPAHFPIDAHGLSYFDGTHLYEHADPKKGFHQDWGTLIFNYGRSEVANFLISSALFWFDYYHIDGLRVDAVAAMLYLDYSRKEGEWIPNEHGGRENLEAISFIKRLNEEVYQHYPDAIMIAEESTSWPMVSRPTSHGGLGFGLKWNMGWMHDLLSYMSKEPVHRAYHHNNLTFGLLYAFHENFVLPFSHDEVVHGKKSMVAKMPGDPWQKFANLRLLYGYMYAYPGKKLLFMGAEFGQWNEWNHNQSLDWHLLEENDYFHGGIKRFVKDLNQLLVREPALHRVDFEDRGFRWIECNDHLQSVVSFLRIADNEILLAICNFTPVPRYDYRIGIPDQGQNKKGQYWEEILNSDSSIYGGGNLGNSGGVTAEDIPMHGYQTSLLVTVPPLGVLFLKHQ